MLKKTLQMNGTSDPNDHKQLRKDFDNARRAELKAERRLAGKARTVKKKEKRAKSRVKIDENTS